MFTTNPHTVTSVTDLRGMSDAEWLQLDAFRAQDRAALEYAQGREGAAAYWRSYAATRVHQSTSV